MHRNWNDKSLDLPLKCPSFGHNQLVESARGSASTWGKAPADSLHMLYGKLQPSFVFVVAIRRDRTLEPCTNRAYLLYMLILMSLECETGKRCSKRATRWVGTSGTSGAMPWWCIELNQKSQHSNSFQTCIEIGLHIDFGVHVPIIKMARKAAHQTRHRFETNVHRSRPGDRKQTSGPARTLCVWRWRVTERVLVSGHDGYPSAILPFLWLISTSKIRLVYDIALYRHSYQWYITYWDIHDMMFDIKLQSNIWLVCLDYLCIILYEIICSNTDITQRPRGLPKNRIE